MKIIFVLRERKLAAKAARAGNVAAEIDGDAVDDDAPDDDGTKDGEEEISLEEAEP